MHGPRQPTLHPQSWRDATRPRLARNVSDPLLSPPYLAQIDGQSVCDAFELLSYQRRKTR